MWRGHVPLPWYGYGLQAQKGEALKGGVIRELAVSWPWKTVIRSLRSDSERTTGFS